MTRNRVFTNDKPSKGTTVYIEDDKNQGDRTLTRALVPLLWPLLESAMTA
jgi:hypothetical protein